MNLTLNNNPMNFKTRPVNIEFIVKEGLEFLIPVYQRPYVWDDTEIKKLLEDLKHNFEVNSEDYFVGNTYVIKSGKENNSVQYEVIDGQQRFTTFWLISLCFKMLDSKTELTKYLEVNKDIRFDFDIRKEVYEYLKGLLDGTAHKRFEDVSKLQFLKNIASGIETINSFLTSEIANEKRSDFGNYIYANVKFIFNEAPENTDLNALFIALGTSGIQLQQSDILKARLLDKIETKNQRVMYAKIWEACENMNNYFERNVKLSFPYETNKVEEKDFKEFNADIFSPGEMTNIESHSDGLTIKEIIESHQNSNSKNEQELDTNQQCRSIISFNVLLFHVLRIYRKNNNFETDIDSLDPKKLIQTFKLEEIEDVTGFIKLLWKVRYAFDKHVVKWLKEEDESLDDEEKLLLSKINSTRNGDKLYFPRKEQAFSNTQMLQSVLYFTGGFVQQYWLTPFLYFLLKNDFEVDDDSVLKELERIDNIMLPGDKKDMSWNILNNKNSDAQSNSEAVKAALNKCDGTGFNHYWFYKLEYLLWKNWEDKNRDEFKRYRITSKNSIEHVFSQDDEYKKKLHDLNDNTKWLDSFGNLALLSVGQNSSYSNQDVDKKKIDFKRKDTYDSLKLAKIYSNDNWNTEEIKKHRDEMIEFLKNHYQ